MSSISTIILSSGSHGARKARLKEIPKKEAGISRHAGQRSVITPSTPPTVVALRAPNGQLPFFRRYAMNPAFRLRRKTSAAVNAISSCEGATRGSFGSASPNAPNSHENIKLSRMADEINEIQKLLSRRKLSIRLIIDYPLPFRERLRDLRLYIPLQ